MKINITIILIFCQTLHVFSQSSINKILQSVKNNNKQIQLSFLSSETSKLSAKTGIYLDNPEIEYIHKFGSPENGNIKEISITQDFDFPSVYFSKREQSNLFIKLTNKQYESDILEVLFETKITCLELIFLNKRKGVLATRLANIKKILTMLERKQKLGSANILEINKAKIQMLNMQTEYDLTIVQIEKFNNKLHVLNGNSPINFNDSVYEPIPSSIYIDSIKNEFLLYNPQLQICDINKQMALSQKKIITAQNLPAFKLGYTSEFSKTENFHGFIIGMSIPLWKNKNTIKYSKSNILTKNANYDNYLSLKNIEIEQTHKKYLKYRKLYNLSISILSGIESERLLQIALEQGEISGLKYFSEIMFFYQTIDNLLLIEKELNVSYSRLMKYKLLNN